MSALFVSIVTPSVVKAQQADSAAAAEALFREGRRLMDLGNYAEACPKFAASYELDVAIGTLLNLANCYQLDGKLASAWARFVEADAMARRAGDEPRGAIARERSAQLEPRLVRVRLHVQSPVRGLHVLVGGREFAAALWGTAIPVDPGELPLVASAAGYDTYSSSFVTGGEGSTVDVEVPALTRSIEPIDEPSRTGEPVAEHAPPEPRGPGMRATGWVLSGLGVAALGAGFGFGANARSLWNSADCSGGTCATAAAQQDAEDARTRANLSTGLVVGGGVVLVTGVVLVIAGRDRHHEDVGASRLQVVPVASVGGGGVIVGGSF